MKDGGAAFPVPTGVIERPGMSLRDWFAGQAMSNPTLCTGTSMEYELRAWFGTRTGIRKEEIAAAQAYSYADALLAERAKGETG